MLDKNFIALIKNGITGNVSACKIIAKDIMKQCDESGDYKASQYIYDLINDKQNDNIYSKQTLNRIKLYTDKKLLVPKQLLNNILDIATKIEKNISRKILFHGETGTGKFSTIKRIARALQYDLYMIDMYYFNYYDEKIFKNNIIDLVYAIKFISDYKKIMVMIKDIDYHNHIKKINHKEINNIIQEFITHITQYNDNIVIVVTSESRDTLKEYKSTFSNSLNFDTYSRKDLITIAHYYIHYYFKLAKITPKHDEIFYKIINEIKKMPTAGELENIVRETLCLTTETNNQEYLKYFYMLCTNKEPNIINLRKSGFTNVEIRLILNRSRSVVNRKVHKELHNVKR